MSVGPWRPEGKAHTQSHDAPPAPALVVLVVRLRAAPVSFGWVHDRHLYPAIGARGPAWDHSMIEHVPCHIHTTTQNRACRPLFGTSTRPPRGAADTSDVTDVTVTDVTVTAEW